VFRLAKVKRPKFPGLTERMVDDDGTSISLVAIDVHRQWTMEYANAAARLKFRFMAYRNEVHDIARNPILPPGDTWIVPFSYWLLATAIHAKPELDAERLADDVRGKITAALLAWPLDPQLNTVQATGVDIRMVARETLAEVEFSVADAKRKAKTARRKQWIRSLIVLVAAILLLRWLRTW